MEATGEPLSCSFAFSAQVAQPFPPVRCGCSTVSASARSASVHRLYISTDARPTIPAATPLPSLRSFPSSGPLRCCHPPHLPAWHNHHPRRRPPSCRTASPTDTAANPVLFGSHLPASFPAATRPHVGHRPPRLRPRLPEGLCLRPHWRPAASRRQTAATLPESPLLLAATPRCPGGALQPSFRPFPLPPRISGTELSCSSWSRSARGCRCRRRS